MDVATDLDWPTPEENAEVLGGSANQRATRGQDDRAYWEDMRDIYLAVTRGRLGFLGADDTPEVIHRASRPQVLAFTDEEAARAWDDLRHPADETAARWSVFPPDGPVGGRRPGRRWAEWLRGAGAEVLVVNPAGPSTFVCPLPRFDAAPRLRRRTIPGDAEPWLDLDVRAAARAHDAEIDSVLRGMLVRDEIVSFDELQGAFGSGNRIGSMLTSSRYRFVQGWWSLRHDMPGRGAVLLLDGAEGDAAFGDGTRTVDAYLRAAELLRPVWSGEVEVTGNDVEVMRLQALRLRHDLGVVEGDHRRDEIAGVLEWLPEVRRDTPR